METITTFIIEVEIPDVNGKAVGVVTARDAEGNTIHKATGNFNSDITRRRFGKVMAEKLGDESVTETCDQLILGRLDQFEKMAARQVATGTINYLKDTPQEVIDEAKAILCDPHIYDRIAEHVAQLGAVGEKRLTIAVYLVGTSRLQAKPVSAIMRGASSAGKSYRINTVAKLFPKEAKLEAHALSPKSLNYLGPDDLRHKFVIGGERARTQDDEQADATKSLREMISDGVLRTCTVEKDSCGKLITVKHEVEGPIAYVESTSATKVFAEDENRCLIFTVDESPEQTQRIIESAALSATGKMEDVSDRIVPVHHAMQRLLKPLRVRIPFAPFLAEHFPVARVEARRAMPHLLGMISASALLRQFQKAPNADGSINADDFDYEIARRVIAPTMERLRGSIDAGVRRVWKSLQKHARPGEEFSRNRTAFWTGIRENDAGARLRVLSELGYIIETQEHRGSKPAKYKLNDNPDTDLGALAGEELPTQVMVAAYMAEVSP